MQKDKNKAYAPCRIKRHTYARLCALRDQMALRDNRARIRQGASPRQNPLSVNDVIETLLYRHDQHAARGRAAQGRKVS
jgi:hypothetical protein